MKVILFQGDSITDTKRSKEDLSSFGYGYPTLIKSSMGFDHPGQYSFINKGIGGNRIVDLYARIKVDIINLKPDVVSILIGVNDVWAELSDDCNGVDADKYYKLYCMLVEEIRESLPGVQIMILEPFVLKGISTETKWETFRGEVYLRAEKARAVAEKYGFVFVPLQEKFNEAEQVCPARLWLWDGVHPTNMGHELIKREWIKAFRRLEEITGERNKA